MKRSVRQLLLAFTLVVAATTMLAAPASAASWKQVLQECILEAPLTGYTRAELYDAKRHATGERVAYTECVSRLNAAIAALGRDDKKDDHPGASKSSADIDGDGVVTPEEKRAAKHKKTREAREVAQVTDTLQPDDAAVIGGGGDSGGGDTSLILALVALALLAIGGGTWYAARRNPAIANALRRVPPLGRRG